MRFNMRCVVGAYACFCAVLSAGSRLCGCVSAPFVSVRLNGAHFGMIVAVAAIPRFNARNRAGGRKGYYPVAEIVPKLGNASQFCMIFVAQANSRLRALVFAVRFQSGFPCAPAVTERGNCALIRVFASVAGARFNARKQTGCFGLGFPTVPVVPRCGNSPRLLYVRVGKRGSYFHARFLAGGGGNRYPFAEVGVFVFGATRKSKRYGAQRDRRAQCY